MRAGVATLQGVALKSYGSVFVVRTSEVVPVHGTDPIIENAVVVCMFLYRVYSGIVGQTTCVKASRAPDPRGLTLPFD